MLGAAKKTPPPPEAPIVAQSALPQGLPLYLGIAGVVALIAVVAYLATKKKSGA